MLNTLPGHVHIKTIPHHGHRPVTPGAGDHRPQGTTFSPSITASPGAGRACHRLIVIGLEAAFAVRPPTQLRMAEYSAQVRQLVQIRHRRVLRGRSGKPGRVILTSFHIRREHTIPDSAGTAGKTLLEVCGTAHAVSRRWAFAARVERESPTRPWRMTALRLF